jgi:hypothetical protein
LDSLGLTVGLRQTLSIEFPQGSGFEPMLAQDVLGWAESWVPGARRVVRSAGAQGLAVVQPTADTLRRIVEAARDGSLPHQAWDRPQIKRALDDLARALQQVAEFAQTNVGGQSYGSGNALEAGLRGTSGRTARSTGATVV